MSHSIPVRHPRSVFVRTLLTALALVAFMVVPLAAAQAHDAVEATTPTDGSALTQVPEKVTLTFSNTPIAIGSEILITDAAGANWAQGPVNILDNVVSQNVTAGAPAGKYTVAWRVVSSDSHPIEGTFSFTSSGGGTATASAPQPTTASSTLRATDAPATANQGIPWGVIAAGVGILAIIIAGLLFAKRALNKSTG